MKMPELFKSEDLQNERVWREYVKCHEHLWFAVGGKYYFLYPDGSNYSLCYYEGENTGNEAEWTFSESVDFLAARIFDGKTILERLDEVMCYEPDYPVVVDTPPTST